MKEKFQIGQIVTLTQPLECQGGITGATKVYPAGTKMTVTAGKYFMFPDGKITMMPEDAIVLGYDHEAIAEAIFLHLKRHTNIEDIVDDEDDYYSKKHFCEVISEALDNIL